MEQLVAGLLSRSPRALPREWLPGYGGTFPKILRDSLRNFALENFTESPTDSLLLSFPSLRFLSSINTIFAETADTILTEEMNLSRYLLFPRCARKK